MLPRMAKLHSSNVSLKNLKAQYLQHVRLPQQLKPWHLKYRLHQLQLIQ